MEKKILFFCFMVMLAFPISINAEIFINEIHYDNSGTDSGEAIEIAGRAGTDLKGSRIFLYNGKNGEYYDEKELNGIIPDEQNGFGTLYFEYPVNGIQNGAPDGIALFDSEENLIQFLSYEGSFTASSGPADGEKSVDIKVSESSGTEAGYSLQLKGRGYKYSDFSWKSPQISSFGSVNKEQLFEASAPGSIIKIHEIQGDSDESPLKGKTVIIEGIVTGDYQSLESGLKGFYLQEEDSDTDGNDSTSEGIFIYDNGFGVDVKTGDKVEVKGVVAEYKGLTEIKNIESVKITGSGSVSAGIVNLPVSSIFHFERYEGMFIKIPQKLYVTGNYTLGKYGEVDLSVNSRLYSPTSIVKPGGEALALKLQNDLSRIQLDDGSSRKNPFPVPQYFGSDKTLRAGDSTEGLVGVLSYGFGTYEIHPVNYVDFTRENHREELPPDVGGNLKIASFNVLNYFTTLDANPPVCGPDSNQQCRGANTIEELKRQRKKIVNAIGLMDADIIGIMEIENHPEDHAIKDLVDSLNLNAGAEIFDYVKTGIIGKDVIKVGFVYKKESVDLFGEFKIIDSSVSPLFNDDKNRPGLAQTFEHRKTKAKLTIVVNHLKSKGSSCESLGDPDTGDGQGNCNLTRKNAAKAIVNWLSKDPTKSGDKNFLIIGDLNSYSKEDPIEEIRKAGYEDLIENFLQTPSYSYVYKGEAGYLDHAFANEAFAPQVAGVGLWHINADEPSALDYNDYNQEELYSEDIYRSSDHDPVIIGLDLKKSYTEVKSNLGNNRLKLFPDIDIFSFDGKKDEEIVLSIEGDENGSSTGEYLSLMIGDEIRGVSFFKAEYGKVSLSLKTKLPANGQYNVSIAEKGFGMNRFNGDYTLKINRDANLKTEALVE